MPDCTNQWKIDVNDRYERAVGVVTSLSSASLVLPILFLKDIAKIDSVTSFATSLNHWAFLGWGLLSLSILSAIIYYFSSAKWVKLAWGQQADIFWLSVNEQFIEWLLDISYFLMMTSFISGLATMIIFMVTFTTSA
jgi:hypothetical protein